MLSEETAAVLWRVGRALGEREGTGPEDDFLLRMFGRRKRAEGRAEATLDMAREILAIRGVAVSAGFPDSLPPQAQDALRQATQRVIAAAAYAAKSEADFVARVGKTSR